VDHTNELYYSYRDELEWLSNLNPTMYLRKLCGTGSIVWIKVVE